MASKAGGGEGKDGEDYYATLGLELGATAAQISKAYKKQALKFHPDRNPNDPLAGQRFHALQQAYDVLSDPEARAAFDALIQARLNRKRKLSTMDAQRRNLKQTLEERENAFKRQRADELDAQRRLAARMARLKEETAAKMQQEKLRRQQTQDRVAAPSSSTSSSDEEVVVKLRWGKKEGWDDEAGVRSALERAGCPAPLAVAVRRRGGGAMATFASLADADAALARLPPPLTGRVRRSRASTPPASSSSSSRADRPSTSTPASAAAGSTPSAAAGLGHADFESQVLARMAMAAAAMRQQQQQQQQHSTAPPPVQQNSE
ncbi:DnaJ [Acanthamoeba castellanii str. Neff]|uniref:DnaJ n=1 Tax=Acanthamoeba castellanii (strain ATCC 30010 / Neff) TaxID=1257118 RepID=L8H312_ACACF|nr:DnaJ [Acanthamoeba castellanii str. Neff]ELR19934.1 DnaJ [Acanthamoeba castellanii str. Neff]